MLAQVPFNDQDAVDLNLPMTEMMDDGSNLLVNINNFKKLKLWDFCLEPNTNLLEVGCGRGYFLEELYKKGEGNYFGLEPIPSEYRETLKKLKLVDKSIKQKVVNKTLEKASFKNDFFDVITSYHVFEHLENPIVLLDIAKKWLKKNGKLTITCPNVEGFIPQRNLNAWRCNLPSHRWLPGRKRLLDLCERSGLKVIRYFTYGGYPAPRKPWQDVFNYLFQLTNQGDVISLVAVKE